MPQPYKRPAVQPVANPASAFDPLPDAKAYLGASPIPRNVANRDRLTFQQVSRMPSGAINPLAAFTGAAAAAVGANRTATTAGIAEQVGERDKAFAKLPELLGRPLKPYEPALWEYLRSMSPEHIMERNNTLQQYVQ